MGAEFYFYIQKKDVGRKWESIFLFNKEGEIADIYRCGRDLLDTFSDWGLNVSDEDIKELAVETGWYIDDDEDIRPTNYCISLAKLKYLTTKNYFSPYDTEEEGLDTKKFYENLVYDIDTYLHLTDEDYVDIDNIRIICFVSY